MELFRLHAYSVVPNRPTRVKKDGAILPAGGAITVNAVTKRILADNENTAAFPSQSTVDFNLDPKTRTSDVRDNIISFGFGEPSEAKAAALDLALRLARSMDDRSDAALLVPAAYKDGDTRRVILWVFPKEDALQLRSGDSGPTIEIVRDVFSQRSRLRKAARFEGRNLKTEFLDGTVLDSQAGYGETAAYWMTHFLGCTLSIKSAVGSRMLADCLRKAFEKVEDFSDREQLHSAAIAVRLTKSGTVSLGSFAAKYLEGPAAEAFLSAAPNPDSVTVKFAFDREAFDTKLQFRVFQLDSGVYVSTPLSQVGKDKSVKLSGDEAKQTLKCDGTIVHDKMRARHG